MAGDRAEAEAEVGAVASSALFGYAFDARFSLVFRLTHVIPVGGSESQQLLVGDVASH